jgi:HSP20 family protein
LPPFLIPIPVYSDELISTNFEERIMPSQKTPSRNRRWNWFEDNKATAQTTPAQRRSNQLAPTSYFRPFSNFFRDMDEIFDHQLQSFGLASVPVSFQALSPFQPQLDIAAQDGAYTLTVEVPGVNEKDIELHVSEEGQLVIRGEKKSQTEDKRKDYEFVECSYGTFERSLDLPEDVRVEDIEARFKNGVLTITLPRQEASNSRTRQIPIEGREAERGANASNPREENTKATSANERPSGPRRAA